VILPVSAVIQELQRIPRATWNGPDPAKPPIIPPPAPHEIAESGFNPAFDDEGFVPATSPKWDEAVSRVGRHVTPSADGRSHLRPSGIDALAWYSSFHSSQDRWGVYVPLSSLPIIDSLYLSDLPMKRAERWRLAWDVLIAHEIIHFAVDYAVAWFELLYHAPIRRAVSDRMTSEPGWDVFPIRSSYLEIEETLANGNVLREVVARVGPEIGDALRRFIRQQPLGYRDGEQAETDKGFAAAASETLRSYLSVWSSGWNIDPGNPALDLLRLLPIEEDVRTACPVWIINDLVSVGLPEDAVRQITSVKPIEETKSFTKRLDRLHKNHKSAWWRLKDRLAKGIPNGSDFKKWEPEGVWSVRVNDDIRAHLREPSPEDAGTAWLAFDIGGHKKMGHG
jgi:hypothetical protein